ncbi:MAG TPA: HEXXH motif-containing putative peptide modification protein [Kofleriaceae bacterium]
MFFAVGTDEVRWTFASLVGTEPHDDGLRLRLGKWLASKQGADVVGDVRKPGVEFVDSPELEARLLRTFISAPTPGDASKPITAETVEALAKARDARGVHAKLARIREAHELLLETSPELGALFDTVINRVFVVEMDKEIGGSSTKSVGTIWCNPTPGATAWDIAEFMVHELTHQVMFIDEHLHSYYTDRLGAETGSNGFMPRSSIRRARRPLGPVFHSLAVALELVAFRQAAGDRFESSMHPSTDTMLRASQETIRSIVWEDGWHTQFKSRGRFLFDQYRDLWDRLAAREAGVVPALLR